MSVKKSKKKGDATLHCLEQKAKKFHQPLYVYYVAYGHSLHYLRREKEVLTAVFFPFLLPVRFSSTGISREGDRPIQILMCFRTNAF